MIWTMAKVMNLSGNYAKRVTKFAFLAFLLAKKETLLCAKLELTLFAAKWNSTGFKN